MGLNMKDGSVGCAEKLGVCVCVWLFCVHKKKTNDN